MMYIEVKNRLINLRNIFEIEKKFHDWLDEPYIIDFTHAGDISLFISFADEKTRDNAFINIVGYIENTLGEDILYIEIEKE